MKQIFKSIRSIPALNWFVRRVIKFGYFINFRLFNFASKHWVLSGVEKIELPNGNRFKIFSKGDDYIPNQVYWKGYMGYESSIEVFYYLSLYSKTIIDIGANIGYYSLVASSANPKSKIYAFEPVERVCQRFRKQIKINNIENIVTESTVVSNKDGEIIFYVPKGDGMALASSARKGWVNEVNEESVKCCTLDSYSKNNKLNRIDLVKMDCEFHEYEVLKGMKRIIEQEKPAILMEILMPEAEEVKGNIEDESYLMIEKLMSEWGYNTYLIYRGVLIKTEKLECNKYDRNYLFVKYNSEKIFNLIPEFVEKYIFNRNKIE